MKAFHVMISNAIKIMDSRGNRSQYARDVLTGYQRWSGSDLKGRARDYGASYGQQRMKAEFYLILAGGTKIAIDHGLLVSALPVGQDDFGNALYATDEGIFAQQTKHQARRV